MGSEATRLTVPLWRSIQKRVRELSINAIFLLSADHTGRW